MRGKSARANDGHASVRCPTCERWIVLNFAAEGTCVCGSDYYVLFDDKPARQAEDGALCMDCGERSRMSTPEQGLNPWRSPSTAQIQCQRCASVDREVLPRLIHWGTNGATTVLRGPTEAARAVTRHHWRAGFITRDEYQEEDGILRLALKMTARGVQHFAQNNRLQR